MYDIQKTSVHMLTIIYKICALPAFCISIEVKPDKLNEVLSMALDSQKLMSRRDELRFFRQKN